MPPSTLRATACPPPPSLPPEDRPAAVAAGRAGRASAPPAPNLWTRPSPGPAGAVLTPRAGRRGEPAAAPLAGARHRCPPGPPRPGATSLRPWGTPHKKRYFCSLFVVKPPSHAWTIMLSCLICSTCWFVLRFGATVHHGIRNGCPPICSVAAAHKAVEPLKTEEVQVDSGTEGLIDVSLAGS